MRKDFSAINKFATRESEGKSSFEVIDEDMEVFGDGIIIKLKPAKR